VQQAETPLKILRLRVGARLPLRATAGASGFDLFACLESGPIDLSPDPCLVPTGIAVEAPPGYDVSVRPRSGLTLHGVGVALGTLDSDYRGELYVTMHTLGRRLSYRVEHGDRIAQLVIGRLILPEVIEVESLAASVRGDGGHGSTGRR
jgi:dUTP pyrophosphatase